MIQLPETLGALLEFGVLAGILTSVLVTLITWIAKRFNIQLEPDLRDVLAKLGPLFAGLLLGIYAVLSPEQQATIADMYELWRPVLQALLLALTGAGGTRLAQQAFYRARQKLERDAY